MTLYKKILEVMKDVQYLQKDDEVGFGSGKYKAISEEKVTENVRASLIKNGLVILPVEQVHHREDTPTTNDKGKEVISRLSTVDTKYKIVDVDTGDFEILASSGTGVDTQDKGVGKAMTYSYKYLLLRTFAIPTGEDPDKISSEELDSKLNPNKAPQNDRRHNEQPSQVETITEAQKTAIKALCERKGVTEKTVLNFYQVDDFLNMSKAVYIKAVAYLNKKPDKAVS